MSLISFKAKVRLISEDDMEMEDRDLGISPKNITYVITDVAFLSDFIYKIVKYDSKKTLVYVTEYEGQREIFLVYEKFSKVVSKWQTASECEEDLILGEKETTED